MTKINITCETCSVTHSVNRTNEIPKDVPSRGCNWCPSCEEKAQDYYDEWYNRRESKETTAPVPDNQLCMPFELDLIEQCETVRELKTTL